MNESGVHKAAVLMLALGENEAAEVMKHLDPHELQKLGRAMSSMRSVSSSTLESVLQSFAAEAEKNTSIGMDSEEYIRAVLTKALGDDQAAALLKRILISRETSGIESLKTMESKAVADLIRNEHPQIIATILVHLERVQASEVLAEFTTRLRNDVVLRIATLDGVQPAALNELNDVLTKLLIGGDSMAKKAMGGTRATAEIMNFMNGEAENSVMESLSGFDPDLAQQVRDQMFVFDNLLDLADRDIQLILREVPSESLIIALKGAREEVRDKIFKNMSQRAAEMMRDDLDAKGPVKVSEVERQQKEILQIVRRLAEEGQISLMGESNETYV